MGTAFFIIVAAVMMVLGSAMWIRPSAREKRQMVMRQTAMARGIGVQLTSIDDPFSPGEKVASVAYRLRAKESPNKVVNWKIRRANEWDRQDLAVPGWVPKWSDNPPTSAQLEELNKQMLKLPADVLALELQGPVLSLYWQEEGGSEEVERLYILMQAIQKILWN